MKLTKSQLIKVIKEELKEAYGGALGPFPGRYNKKRPADAAAGDTVSHEQEPELGQGLVLAVGPQGTLVKWPSSRRLHDPRVLKVVLRRATWATIAGLDEELELASVSPRRGHPMYKTDDELREIGADIGNILELTEKVISNLSEMQARYGEMAHMGAYARMADNAAQKLSEKYRDALDALSRSKQLGEKKLTKPETKEKERIVKGMKKDKKGFKKRYGDDAERVMYATATKQAKKRK